MNSSNLLANKNVDIIADSAQPLYYFSFIEMSKCKAMKLKKIKTWE